MNRLVITQLKGQKAAALLSEKRVLQIEFELAAEEETGVIYIGKVKNIVKNLNAAFVEYRPGVNGFYSLTENQNHFMADGRTIKSSALRSGDEIIVQVARAAVKTKDAVLSSDLNLTGSLVVLTCRAGQLGISSKIREKKWREERKSEWEAIQSGRYPLLSDCKPFPQFGLVLRTNAMQASPEEIWNEYTRLCCEAEELLQNGMHRTCFHVLHRPDSFAKRIFRDMPKADEWEFVTDLFDVYEEISRIFPNLLKQDGFRTGSLHLYKDSQVSLSVLYNLESALSRALSRQVWLKSGGYLVIDPTEAMTVIDVNSGKNTDKRSPEELYLKTNLEAAEEIAAQMRLRNLSGIIIIDFIDLKSEPANAKLLTVFRRYLAADPVPTTLVDMTALGLVEVTRKKVKPPLYEQIAGKNADKNPTKPVDIFISR